MLCPIFVPTTKRDHFQGTRLPKQGIPARRTQSNVVKSDSVKQNRWGMSPTITVIVSAGVGALVSTGGQLVSQYLERKSRREELALTKASEMAQNTYMSSIELIKLGRHSVKVYPQNMMVRDAFRMFRHLLNHGELDPQTHQELEEELRADAARESRS